MSRYNTKKKSKKEIDPYKRYQTGLTVEDLFPKRNDGKCACGCEKPLPPRKRRWASKECNKKAVDYFFVVKGDMKKIREQLYKKEKAVCRNCQEEDRLSWEADHIVEVRDGGGGRDLFNYQTLCLKCHKEKTKNTTQRIVEERKKDESLKK